MTDLLSHLIPKSKARRRSKTKDLDLTTQLINLRLARGLTQEELASEASVGISQVRKLEQGKRNVTLSTLDKILNQLRGTLIIVDKTER